MRTTVHVGPVRVGSRSTTMRGAAPVPARLRVGRQSGPSAQSLVHAAGLATSAHARDLHLVWEVCAPCGQVAADVIWFCAAFLYKKNVLRCKLRRTNIGGLALASKSRASPGAMRTPTDARSLSRSLRPRVSLTPLCPHSDPDTDCCAGNDKQNRHLRHSI